jgi:dihydrodipicolinate synthase/N-acetylneuraminate lyase
MNTKPVDAQTLAASVVAVPPLARREDLSLDREANAAIIRHIEAGGVTSLLYGGNANFYHIPLSEYAAVLELLRDAAAPDTLMIPSVGPAYGAMLDQAAVLRDFEFPTAMVLPQQGVATSAGVATGVRRFVEALGRPALLYIKQDGFLEVDDVRRLFNDGLLSVIKYAVVRDDPAHDPYLRELTGAVDPKRIMSGIGEQPAIVHLGEFGLGGFTSGCVCVAPKLSMEMLHAIQAGDLDRAEAIRGTFRPLEDLRNAINPIRVLHAAVALAGIAVTGPVLPLLSEIDESDREAVEDAARTLLAANG